MKFVAFLQNKIKGHWLIIVFSLLLTTLVLMPVIIFPFVVGDANKGINIARYGVDDHLYLIRAKEILEGNKLGNPALREWKDTKVDYFFSISEYFFLWPVRVLGLDHLFSVVKLYSFLNFISVFLLLLLMYTLVFQIHKNKKLATIASLFVVGGYSIVYNKTLFYSDFNIYVRTVVPYIPSIFFFLFLNVYYRCIRVCNWKWTFVTGALFGLLFYVYFYLWTFVLVFCGVMPFMFLLKKDKNIAKHLFTVFSVGVVLGIYNVYRILSFMRSPDGELFTYFSWSEIGHGFVMSKIGLALMFLLVFFIFKKKVDYRITFFILGTIIAGWVSLNQQIITGKILQYGHYYWYYIVPLSIMFGFYMIWAMIDKERHRQVLFWLTLCVVFLNTAVGQYKSTMLNIPTKVQGQEHGFVIEGLQKDSNSGVVLTSDNQIALTYLMYTNHDLFWSSVALYNTVPLDRIQDALFVYLFLNKKARENPGDYLLGELENTSRHGTCEALYRAIEGYKSGFSFYKYNNLLENKDLRIIEQRKDLFPDIMNAYYATMKDENSVVSILQKYGVNYIVWDKNEHPEWDLDFLENKKELGEYNNIAVYSLLY